MQAPKFFHIFAVSGWDRCLLDDFLEDGSCVRARAHSGTEHDEPVFENRIDEPLDVIGDDKAPAAEQGQRLRRTEQRRGSAWADAELDFRMFAGSIDDVNHVIHDRFVDVDFPALVLKEQNLGRLQRRRRRIMVVSIGKPFEDFLLGRSIGITHLDAHEKSIQLRFRQGIRSVVFDWILRRQDHERARKRMGDILNRHRLSFIASKSAL